MRTNIIVLHHQESEPEFQAPVKAVGYAMIAEIVTLALVGDHTMRPVKERTFRLIERVIDLSAKAGGKIGSEVNLCLSQLSDTEAE